MKPVVMMIAAALIHVTGASAARAQSADDLRIHLQASVGRQDGGNRVSTGAYIEPGATGKTSMFSFSRLAGICGTGVSPKPVADVGHAGDGNMLKVVSAWTTHVTPLRQNGDAVTFRMQWARTRDNGNPSAIGGDSEVTLRPGQTLSLDVMPQSLEAVGSMGRCLSLSLEVGVIHWPRPDQDLRLVALDLWLVERHADGTERSQPLALRGRYNQPIPFYFDGLIAGTKTLDIFGDLQIAPGERSREIRINTRTRIIDSTPPPPPPGYPAGARWPPPHYVGSTTATLRLVPGEVVSVSLPPVDNGRGDAAAFASRTLSFRMRITP